MVTDDERRRVAERLRCAAEQRKPYTQPTLACFIGADCVDIWTRLADLIEPEERKGLESDAFERGIDSIYEWCFERLEGADGAEDELYRAIMSAVEGYRHPELVTARTVRAVDREALLALADEIRKMGKDYAKMGAIGFNFNLLSIASKIRKACGEAGTGPTGPIDRDGASRSPLCGHCECAPWCGRGPGPDGDCRVFEPRVGEGEPPYNLYSLYEAVLGRRPRDEFAIEDDEVEELVGALIDVCNVPGHEVIERAGSR